ncbi:NAD(P)/FAD-dependent oxidoreductase [Hathewaya histolytica]|uniref:Pyridine nucleotide-disulfide oxidoreductase family protein n=1 Tax=Hathewaya histolytica TaxID=1498 RepID=A0A4U9RKC7_HATHI|nr:NAD(P)/FAD-dependent oxidoreductase [Hathewaya histolytica]VTQ89290.1 pyridine nucleotide-disulfide oxidoreductase family protein [Hathewaya histolytica]
MSKIIIIGGGPAGIMAAIAASKNHSVILIEKNEKLGKKLFITGKGRCNVTNNKDISEFFDQVPRNSHFLYSSFYTFTNEDTKNFFENAGVKLKVERGDRVFPQSDKSSDIIKALECKLEQSNVTVLLNKKVSNIAYTDKKINYIEFQDGSKLEGDYFILCTGGASYPQTGSNGEGYKFSQKLGHSIKNIQPALVPMETKESFVKELQGLSLKNVEVTFKHKNKIIFKDFGEMLFTHYGISGPLILSASAKISEEATKDGLSVFVNFKPALGLNELDKRIQKDFKKYINKDFKNSLNDLLPSKLIDTIIELSGIDPNKKVNLITKEERRRIVELLTSMELNIKKYRPIAEAIITSGGINTKEIDSSTMKSKIISNLSFAGEIIDLHAFTGGYNLQIAFSTGYIAGISI